MAEVPKLITEIVERVTRREQAMEPLFRRMDADYLLYNLDRFIPAQGDGIHKRDAYTSNRPRNVADKMIGAITGAGMILRVENDASNEHIQESNNNFERFAIGALRLADERLVRAVKPPLRAQLAFYGVVRGGVVAVRRLLRKRTDGSTYVDATPIDPRHLVWQSGPDGVLWAAVVTMRERADIRSEYPDFTFEDEEQGEKHDNDRREKVVDYYWTRRSKGVLRHMNAVIVAGSQWAKKPAATNCPTFPIEVRAVGSNPGVDSSTIMQNDAGGTTVEGIEHFGESIFAPIRDIVKFENRAFSYTMAVVALRVRNVQKVFSADGTKELEQTLDEDATEIPLMAGIEDVQPLEITQLGRDADALYAAIAGAADDGSVPPQSYGRLPAAISGSALRILGQSIGDRLAPFIRPIESLIEGIAEGLGGQYETQAYQPIKVSGRTFNSLPFNGIIMPEHIMGHGPVTVKLTPELPEDIHENWATAQIAATIQDPQTGEPAVSMQTISEKILRTQDYLLERQRIYASRARMSTPELLLMTQVEAAAKSEEWDTVEYLQTQIARIQERELIEHIMNIMTLLQLGVQDPAAALQAMRPQDGNGGGNGRGTPRSPTSGLRPEMVPLSGGPYGRPDPSPDAGSNTVGNVRERLANVGLEYAAR
jgi:hypothetical protein